MSLGFTTKSDQFRDMWAKRTNSTTAPSPYDSTVPRFVQPGGAQQSASQAAQSPQTPDQLQESTTAGENQAPQTSEQAQPNDSSNQPNRSEQPASSSTQAATSVAQSQSSRQGSPAAEQQPTQNRQHQTPKSEGQQTPQSSAGQSPSRSAAQAASSSHAPPQADKDGMAIDWTQAGRRHLPHSPHTKRLDIPHEIVDNALMLKNGTELSYKVPISTTLIRVYGPVGMNETAYGSQCYADLDPVPSWWVNGSFPLSASQKAMREDNHTLFLLPVDPDVRTTVRVGPLGLDATCYVSGFSSYPFH